jgi:hypothetical protein
MYYIILFVNNKAQGHSNVLCEKRTGLTRQPIRTVNKRSRHVESAETRGRGTESIDAREEELTALSKVYIITKCRIKE